MNFISGKMNDFGICQRVIMVEKLSIGCRRIKYVAAVHKTRKQRSSSA